MDVFALHLKALLSGRRTDDVADAIGVARSAVYAWLKAEKLPDAKNVEALLRMVGRSENDEATWSAYVAAQRGRVRTDAQAAS